MNLGIQDREIAILTGNGYLESGNNNQDFQAFKGWLSSLDEGKWKGLFINTNIEDNRIMDAFDMLISRDLAASNLNCIFEFDLAGDEISEGIDLDQFIIVKYENGFWLTTHNYQRKWKLEGANIEKIMAVDRSVNDFSITDIDRIHKTIGIKVI